MDKKSLQYFLESAGIEENTWTRLKNLHVIGLDTDGNQYYTYINQKIKFDTDDQLVEIKYSELKPASAYLNRFTYSVTNNHIRVEKDLLSSVFRDSAKRQPKVGDRVYGYNSSTSTLVYSIISAVDNSNRFYETLTFSDNTLITAISANSSMIFFLIFSDADFDTLWVGSNPTRYYYQHDISSYPADIYIGFDLISSFDFEQNFGSFGLIPEYEH